MKTSKNPISRRSFLRSTSFASAAAAAFPAIMRAQPGGTSPNGRLNIACVGVGGRGKEAVESVKDENIVAFCDVDEARAAETYGAYPDVPRFRDYREMLDKLGSGIDAVTVSTPDHMHYPIARAALELGKHVFTEKPLTHTIWEARQLARLSREKRVATQMGNQGHANDGTRVLKEWYEGGILGEVTQVHSWTDRPIWPQGVRGPDHSKFIPVVPPTLDWNLWLGVAADRPYDPAYVPFKWRGYWDFGTGALGDMGCHILDGAFWALGTRAPSRISALSAKANELSGPTASVICFDIPAAGSKPAIQWTWYDGGMQPQLPGDWESERKLPENGSLIVGTRATVLASTYYESVRIVPETKMKELAPSLPPRSLPRIEGGHFAEWIRACKGGPAAGSNFEYASRLTEFCLLSNVAVRSRRPIEWNADAMEVSNLPEANAFLTKEYRAGFGV